jgi:hypothetical protein
MRKNWIKKAAKKADINEDIAILTTPVASQYLDGLLLETHWPSSLLGIPMKSLYPVVVG